MLLEVSGKLFVWQVKSDRVFVRAEFVCAGKCREPKKKNVYTKQHGVVGGLLCLAQKWNVSVCTVLSIRFLLSSHDTRLEVEPANSERIRRRIKRQGKRKINKQGMRNFFLAHSHAMALSLCLFQPTTLLARRIFR